jgi:hypothetical protein
VVVIAELQEFSVGELRVVVGDDGIRNPKAVVYIREEQHRLLGLDFGYGMSLDPLGELVYGDEQVCVALGVLCKGPTRSRPHTAKGNVMGII